MAVVNVKNVEKLISGHVGSDNIVKNVTVSTLNGPGENYLSDIFKLDVQLKSIHSDDEKRLHLVAKCVINNNENPLIMEFTKKLMHCEILCYKEIIPTIQSYQKKFGLPDIEFFAKFFGAKYDLADNVANEYDLLILENLCTKGFVNLDRHRGFDVAQAKIVLKDLATFHAVSLAMRLLDPELFESKIKENLLPRPNPPSSDEVGPISQLKLYRKILINDKEFEDISKFDAYAKREIENRGILEMKPVGPFTTLIHCDMWLNNTMQIVDENGKIVENKFLDFQFCAIGSPACDLIFFLVSSVTMDDLKTNFDSLIRFYHANLAERLKSYGCHSDKLNFDSFSIEMEKAAEQILIHCIYMTANVIFHPKGKICDHSKAHHVKVEDVHPVAQEKIRFLIKEASKRNWI